ECHQKMGELSAGGQLICVAFPRAGGNPWSIVNDKGAYFNRNIPEEAHMICGHFTQIYGPLKIIAFDADGNGWSVVAAATLSESVGDDKGTVKIADIYANVQKKLDGQVVGYSCAIGRATVGAYAHGEARTGADGGSQLFLPWTKAHVASVSKLITALATIRVLAAAAARGVRTKDGKPISLDSPIGEFLPKTWILKPKIAAVAMRAFLSQRSGIKTADTPCDDASMKALFETGLATGKFNPDDRSGFYSNCNFAIFRIALPIIDGHDDYVTLCRKNVFDLVGAAAVDCRPPQSGPGALTYAYQYQFPGSSPGANPGDLVSTSGGFGWYLTIEDMAKVLHSLNLNDGRILTPGQWADMTAFPPLGLDYLSDSTGYRWVEKNGGWNLGTTTMTTTAAIFGAGVYGALWMNSDMEYPGFQSNWKRCANCETLVFNGNSMGKCHAALPADKGQHNFSGSSVYSIRKDGIVPPGHQGNWRLCNKCQAVSFAGNLQLGACSAGENHEHGGSANIILPFRDESSPLAEDAEAEWRWCNRCQVLASTRDAHKAPVLGLCAAGGNHDHGGSGNYVLFKILTARYVLYEAYMNALKKPSA
ncbi:beta-lactamase/transpeptidase-like protein, partial [Staphylotrichum tortipilum]